MSHAGMSPVFADTIEVVPGEYRAVMELSMAGDWVVLVHLTLPDSTKLGHQFEMTVLNAEGVRSFQPRVRSEARTLGTIK